MHEATGKTSGRRNPERPNWRQVAKAKEKEKEKMKKAAAKKRAAAVKSKLEKRERKELIELAIQSYSAGFQACAVGDDWYRGFQTWRKQRGL